MDQSPGGAGDTLKMLGIVVLLVVLAYIIPFTLLSRIHAWYGSFLFWIVFSLAVIGLIVRSTRKWRD